MKRLCRFLRLKTFLASMVLAISSCGPSGIKSIFLLKSPAYSSVESEGPYEVVQASKDGCLTAHTTRGSIVYKDTLGFYMNYNLIRNPIYTFVWVRAYLFCFQKINLEPFRAVDADLGNILYNAEYLNPNTGSSPFVLPFGVYAAPTALPFGGGKSAINMGIGQDSAIADGKWLWGTCTFCPK